MSLTYTDVNKDLNDWEKEDRGKQEKHKLTELAMFLLGLENYSEDERKRQGTKHSIHPTRAANRYSSVVPSFKPGKRKTQWTKRNRRDTVTSVQTRNTN